MTAQPMNKFIDPLLALLYAIAAISGALGGCAVAIRTMKAESHAKTVFLGAYVILGFVFGIVTLATVFITGHAPDDVHQLILMTGAGGAAGTMALATSNWAVRAVLKRFGLEVQVTFRKDADERRVTYEAEED